MGHWLLLVTGGRWTGTVPSVWYNEESGFLSIIIPPLLQAAAFLAVFGWHTQCSVHHCYWPARRKTAAGERACWRHHPHPKRTAEDVHAAHYRAVAWHHHDRQGDPP